MLPWTRFANVWGKSNIEEKPFSTLFVRLRNGNVKKTLERVGKLKFILKTLTLSPRYTDTKLATSVLQTETQVTQLFVLECIFIA